MTNTLPPLPEPVLDASEAREIGLAIDLFDAAYAAYAAAARADLIAALDQA